MRWDDSDDSPAYVTLESVSCAECELGQCAARSAQFCPFIIRRYEAGHCLFSVNDIADYVWLITSGVIGLSYGSDNDEIDELRLPGSVLGLRCAAGGLYAASARTLTPVTACGATLRAYESRVANARERGGALPGQEEVTMQRLTRRITCPHSAHLEAIQYRVDGDGTIDAIEACTAFEPCTAVDCDELCRHRLNQKRGPTAGSFGAFGSVHDQHRAGGVADGDFSDAAEQEPPDSAAAVAPGDDEIVTGRAVVDALGWDIAHDIE